MSKVPFNPWEFHHLYWGFLMALGSCIWLSKTRLKKWLQIVLAIIAWIGIVCIIDDIGQHWGNGTSIINTLFHNIWNKVFGEWWPFGNL